MTTKAGLEVALQEAEDELREQGRAAAQLQMEYKALYAEGQKIDAEARVIGECVTAIDTLSVRDIFVPQAAPPPPHRVRRVLRFLADRYGVAWYDPPVDDSPLYPDGLPAGSPWAAAIRETP